MMDIFDISGEVSRNIARALFPNTNNGRSISKMTADSLGTSVGVVHFLGFLAIGIILANKR